MIGSADGDILVSLKENAPAHAGVGPDAAAKLTSEFPDTMFYFLPADMVTQILNFGLPAPIDIQIDRRRSRKAIASSPIRCSRRCVRCRGSSICGFSSRSISPSCTSPWIAPRHEQAGFTERDVANSLLVALSGSFQDDADVLPEPEERRRLQRGDADAAVPDSVAAGSPEHPDHGARTGASRRFWAT